MLSIYMTMYSVFVGIPRDISLVGQSWIVNIKQNIKTMIVLRMMILAHFMGCVVTSGYFKKPGHASFYRYVYNVYRTIIVFSSLHVAKGLREMKMIAPSSN